MNMIFQKSRECIIAFMVLLVAVPGNISAQAKHAKQFTIPDSINTVFQTSCISCHGINGGRFPKARVNFARWGEYDAPKQAEKAMLICSALRKGAMPPKSIRESQPELVPTKEQIDMICKWAQSLKPVKARKQMPAK